MREYEKTGVLEKHDLMLPSKNQLRKGVAILECIQEIPCNPCVDVCPVDAISMEDINAPPVIDYDRCIGCGKCVGICPGLAIFVVKTTSGKALVTLPYEFLPVPRVGDKIVVLDRSGKERGDGVVKKIRRSGRTMVVTVEVDQQLGMDVRNIRVEG
jgi:Fe-S-cluster-containing hydrogenase component 2